MIYRRSMYAFWKFDAILSGQDMEFVEVSARDVSIVGSAMCSALGEPCGEPEHRRVCVGQQPKCERISGGIHMRFELFRKGLILRRIWRFILIPVQRCPAFPVHTGFGQIQSESVCVP